MLQGEDSPGDWPVPAPFQVGGGAGRERERCVCTRVSECACVCAVFVCVYEGSKENTKLLKDGGARLPWLGRETQAPSGASLSLSPGGAAPWLTGLRKREPRSAL